MTFTLLPAVDVADGQTVRPAGGQVQASATSHGPIDAARAFQAAGAEWIHLVDIDAAFARGSNAELLAEVVGDLDIDVQLSGGIRDEPSLRRALSTGCSRVNIAADALGDPPWCEQAIATHGELIAFCLDVRITDTDGHQRHRLAPRGTESDGGDLWDAIRWLDEAGCAHYVVTDVDRDGMLLGPNHDLHRAIGNVSRTPLIASGGISSLADLTELATPTRAGSEHRAVTGAIVGKALDVGHFTLTEALAAVRDA